MVAHHHMPSPTIPSTLSVPVCGAKRSFAAMQPSATTSMESLHAADPTQKRSPLLCGYPSKKCWAWRVEKRNGELHKFCEYHRQKANTNQRRMEQRRKTGRSTQKEGDDDDASTAIKEEPTSITDSTTTAAAPSTPIKAHPPTINTAMANAEKAANASNKELLLPVAGSPRGVDSFDALAPPPLFSWAEVDLDIGMDAAVEYMMIDHAIDAEPSDKPVDLYEEDLYFLEHFIAEIAAGGV
ncbi:hypothetical protein Gpo141_00010731 [Globisporangium polare]